MKAPQQSEFGNACRDLCWSDQRRGSDRQRRGSASSLWQQRQWAAMVPVTNHVPAKAMASNGMAKRGRGQRRLAEVGGVDRGPGGY